MIKYLYEYITTQEKCKKFTSYYLITSEIVIKSQMNVSNVC